MAKKITKEKNTDQIDMDASSGEFASADNETISETDELQLSDIPIDQFLRDPKMSELSEGSEDEEKTSWCPICNEYTIFVDRTCTVCGFVKGSAKKTHDNDEFLQEESSTLDLVSEDDVLDMNSFNSFNDEDEYKDDL